MAGLSWVSHRNKPIMRNGKVAEGGFEILKYAGITNLHKVDLLTYFPLTFGAPERTTCYIRGRQFWIVLSIKVRINGHRCRSTAHLSLSMYLATFTMFKSITLPQHQLCSNTKTECLKLLHPTNKTSYTIPTLAVLLKIVKYLLSKSL